MESEKNILETIRNKISNNIEITSDEIIELKEKFKNSFNNDWWIVIFLLIMFCGSNIKKEDDKECTEITTDTTIQQEI